ncbi:MAG: TetR/AcrR family transcriptional regulator [Alphaproteobacteria bacterium]|nr:TetR/AcrR family transcriptional regulator [Alphaproteobacteria bacterium]MBU1514379.1 TetR/AcrR family transcriptional regulator [Alphaproteobacteria bacterium]MBU2096023.1 TetR/AcrR family transcriptional regulator [Alphaproteobacteria bacterium]MBU2150065.1 TetR/AcrR family transcriptional regulator [Alphaproteobacteria bacterium]MBU2308578.1 TetR/AcrR family transcriptional regulator [Alphaproteobacteria bacterium]
MSVAPTITKREDRRETILDVARECFLAEGFAATSMSTIAARLGGSKGTLYNYFKSKEELFAAMMQRTCAELQATLFDVGPEAGDTEAKLAHFARGFLNHLMTPEAIAIQRVVVSESERFPELGRVFYESGPKIVLGRIGAYLEELMAAGRLRRTDPIVAAQHFKDLAISGVYWPHMWGVAAAPTPAQFDQQVTRAVDTFLRAYAP